MLPKLKKLKLQELNPQLKASPEEERNFLLCTASLRQRPRVEKKLALKLKPIKRDFPGGAVVENPPANAGDTGLSPGPGRSHMPRSN